MKWLQTVHDLEISHLPRYSSVSNKLVTCARKFMKDDFKLEQDGN